MVQANGDRYAVSMECMQEDSDAAAAARSFVSVAWVSGVLLIAACGDGTSVARTNSGLGSDSLTTATSGDGPQPDSDGTGTSSTSGGPVGSTSTGGLPTSDPTLELTSSSGGPTAKDCGYQANDFGAAMQELDIDPGAPDRLSFVVQALPPPETILSATLRFASHDADHPREEGQIFVNGARGIDLPANAAWDNLDGNSEVDITGATIEGANAIEFGGGTFSEGTFYRIGNVEIVLVAEVETCPEPPPLPAMEQTIHYSDATYTEREKWVHRCQDGFDYAYTAGGDEHVPLDCGGLYVATGTRSGTATFSFTGLVAASYEVAIRSRHTINRNPQGALFIVDGESDRVQQDDNLDFTTDIWGTKFLEGDIDVVLDSTMENESDSVIWVRLTPVEE